MEKELSPSRKHLIFQDERKPNLVCVLVQAGGVDAAGESDLNSRAQGLGVTKMEHTSVVDFGLGKGVLIKFVLGANFKSNRIVAFRVPSGLASSFNFRAHTVVVRGRENG